FYLVSLTGQFIDNNGDTCILYIENPVEVHAVADFDYTIGCAGSSTVFTDLSTYTQGTTLSYSWDFGDGNNSTLPNPSNVYTSPGMYTVTLTVNAGGCMSTSIQTVTIPALPVANLSVPSPVCAGQPVLFTDLSVPSANITDWEWSFGDGAQSTAQNPQHTYLSPGTYTVTLNVWDFAGCTDDTTLSINVLPAIPDTITWSGSLIHCSGETDTLFAPAGLSYQWSNGATTQMIIVNQTGDYQVTVTGLNGCPYVAGPVKVEFLPPPVAIVNLNPGPVVCQGTLVTMCATQFQGYSYEWYNVTANISWGTGPCNYYFANSNATFLLIVTDQLGCKDTSAPVQIWVNPNPVVTISASGSTTFCKGGSVTLTANSSGGVIAYAWSNGSSSSSITVTSGDNYCVTVTDTNGCSSTACKQVTVWPLPDMSLVMTGCIELCLPDTIPGPPGYASYQWQLNGTNIPVSACGNCQNLPVTQPGNYTLILTTVNGCIDTSDILEVREDVCDTTLLDCFAANDPVFTKILSDVTYT
ncbi:MAG: PKD domain-containing protein, partial [Chloroflexi bacterium]